MTLETGDPGFGEDVGVGSGRRGLRAFVFSRPSISRNAIVRSYSEPDCQKGYPVKGWVYKIERVVVASASFGLMSGVDDHSGQYIM